MLYSMLSVGNLKRFFGDVVEYEKTKLEHIVPLNLIVSIEWCLISTKFYSDL